MRLTDRVFVINIFLSFFSILYAQPQQQDFWLEMDDGVKLDVTYFIPAGMVPVGGFPGIVFVHGLGGSKGVMINKALQYAKNGFATVAYSVRGQGDSEGLTTVFSYREQADLDSINETLEHENLWTLPYWDADGSILLDVGGQNPTYVTIPVLNDHATRIPEGETCSISLFPDEVYLIQNYPNPFNSATAIKGGILK